VVKKTPEVLGILQQKRQKLGKFAPVAKTCAIFLGKFLSEILQGFNF
jgi:hypothetical protein